MKYVFLFALIITSMLNATPILNINSDNTQLQDFTLEYFVDETLTMSLQDVKKQSYVEDRSALSLGVFQETVWLRFKLQNSTNSAQKLYIHNENGYIANALEFYELLEDKTINSMRIVLSDRKDTDVKMYGTDAIFSLNLDINQTKTIYIKSVMKVMQYPHFTIYNEINSKKRASKNNSLLLIILGMLVALALYHSMLYVVTGYKEYAYYALYLTSAVIWESFLSGAIANGFDLYFNPITERFLLSVLLLPIFLSLFAKSLFNTKTSYKTENQFLDSVIALSLFILLIGIFNVHKALIITSLLFVYMFGVFLITTYSIMRKGNPLALTFLLANTVFSIFMLITDAYYLGFINYTPFVFNAASVGVIIEGLILSLLLSYRIKLLQKNEIQNLKELSSQAKLQEHNRVLELTVEKAVKDSREKDKILFQQSKMISMGEMIENIAHQWRQPLAEVNASVSVIDNVIYEKYDSDAEIDRELTNIENLTNHMSKTINSFQNYFKGSQKKKEFSLRSAIYESILILGKSLQNNNVVININIEEDFIHKGYENEFQQVMLVLLNNAKEALLSNKIYEPKIEVKVYKHYQEYKITVCDNAGGIKNAIIEKIFDPYFTTKKKNKGTGLGLYIAKMIAEEKMNGRISVQNVEEGSCFSVILIREK